MVLMARLLCRVKLDSLGSGVPSWALLKNASDDCERQPGGNLG